MHVTRGICAGDLCAPRGAILITALTFCAIASVRAMNAPREIPRHQSTNVIIAPESATEVTAQYGARRDLRAARTTGGAPQARRQPMRSDSNRATVCNAGMRDAPCAEVMPAPDRADVRANTMHYSLFRR